VDSKSFSERWAFRMAVVFKSDLHRPNISTFFKFVNKLTLPWWPFISHMIRIVIHLLKEQLTHFNIFHKRKLEW
jgi:hypothetical protein